MILVLHICYNYSMNVMLLLIKNGISEFREFIGLNYPGILKWSHNPFDYNAH